MKLLLRKIWLHPFFPLALAFIALNLIVTQDGGQNAKSRLLAMRSFGEGAGNFTLDDHIRVTDDWAQGPNGTYYSNKAPGAMILGFPVFFLADKLHQLKEAGYRDERGLRHDPGYVQSTVTSFFVQVLPYALLVLAISSWLAALPVSGGAIFFFVLAALFANTSVLFMNSFFGHGVSALLQLAGIYFLLRRRYGLAGAYFSFSLLSDYGFAAQIPALLAALWLERPRKKEFFAFTIGAIPAAAFWIVYHLQAFGSPFAIASQFQNPTFVEQTGSELILWGILSLPSPAILWELVFGGARGLVVGQPWVLLLLAPLFYFLVWPKVAGPLRTTAVFSLLSLLGLLLMNASFNGWHGGASAGPRYLSGILPVFALAAALALDRISRGWQFALWAALCVGVAFRGLAYGGTILAPNVGLWGYFFNELLSRPTHALRTGIFFLLVGGAFAWSLRRFRLGGLSFARRH